MFAIEEVTEATYNSSTVSGYIGLAPYTKHIDKKEMNLLY